MGGGDLNLKKSWHPHTLKNQEKVWKAEQTKEQEDTKLNELRKEIDEERTREELRNIGENSGVLKRDKGDKQIEWMYRNNAELINREEYLLGRAIDKNFERLEVEEQRAEKDKLVLKQPINHVEHECVPFSIRSYRDMESTEQVDVQRKTLEDPLMQIKKMEMEKRRKLLDNPVKLKKLQELVKIKRLNEMKRKKSKKTKKVKHKKKICSDSTDSESDSTSSSEDEDDKNLTRKLKKLTQKLKRSNKIPSIKQLVHDIKDETKSKDMSSKKDKEKNFKSPNREPSKYIEHKIKEKSKKSHSRSKSPANPKDGASRQKDKRSHENYRKPLEESKWKREEQYNRKSRTPTLGRKERNRSRSRSNSRERHTNRNTYSNNRTQTVDKPQRYYRDRSRSVSREKRAYKNTTFYHDKKYNNKNNNNKHAQTPERRVSKNPFAKDFKNTHECHESYNRVHSHSPDRKYTTTTRNPFSKNDKSFVDRKQRSHLSFMEKEKSSLKRYATSRVQKSRSRSFENRRQEKYRNNRSRSRSNSYERRSKQNPFSKRKETKISNRSPSPRLRRSRSYEKHVRNNPFSKNKSQRTRRTRSRTLSVEKRSNKNRISQSPPNMQKYNSIEKEKAARLREMMQNAEWREGDRIRAVTKYRNASAREEDQRKTDNFDKNFINKQVQNALANQKSVGARLRANLNNIQRSSTAMDSNFARK